MMQCPVCSHTIPWARLQQPNNEILRTPGDKPPIGLRKGQIPLNNLAVQFVQNVVEERQRATEHYVSHHATRPDIDLPTIILLLDNLWC